MVEKQIHTVEMLFAIFTDARMLGKSAIALIEMHSVAPVMI